MSRSRIEFKVRDVYGEEEERPNGSAHVTLQHIGPAALEPDDLQSADSL